MKKKISKSWLSLIGAFSLISIIFPFILTSCSSTSQSLPEINGSTTTPPSPESPDQGDEGTGTIPDDTVEAEPKEGIDFFYKKNGDTSDSNKITIPTTKNKWVLEKYGNVPLPWKDDKDITDDDLTYMFDYLVANLYYQRDFGARNIESNRFVNTFIKFLINNYRKYPYISFTNKTWMWNVKEVSSTTTLPNDPSSFEEKVYHIKNNHGSNFNSYADALFRPGLHRQQFLQFISYLLSQIRPGMTDIEKVIVAYQMLLSWISYGPGGPISIFSGHTGYCADYASVYALMLNIIGIPAFSVTTKYNEGQLHACTWIYVDTGNNKGPQWYVSDPTHGDQNNDVNEKQGVGYLTSINVFNASSSARAHFLSDVAKSKYEPNLDNSTFISNRFWLLPWTDWASSNPAIGKVGIGDYNYGDTGIMKPKVGELGSDELRTKMVYIDGYWYYISIPNIANANNIKLWRQKTNETYKDAKEVAIPNAIAKQILNYQALKTVNLMQFNNKLIFEASDSNNGDTPNRYLLIFDTYNGQILWESLKRININYNNSIVQSKLNLDIFNKQIQILDNAGNIVYTQKLSDQELQFILSTPNKYMTDTDIDNAHLLFSLMANIIRTGDRNNQVTIQEKQDYFNYLDQVLIEAKQTHKYNEAINLMNTAFLELEKTSSKISNKMAPIRNLNSKYYISKQNFIDYGFSFGDGLDVVLEPKDLIDGNDAKAYNIYFSPNDQDYVLLKANATSLKIVQEDFIKLGLDGPQGYYYIEYFPFGKPELARKSNKTLLEISNEPIPSSPGQIRFKENYYNTNYSINNDDWANQEFYLITDFSFNNFDNYEVEYTINFVHYDTHQINNIYQTTLNKSNPSPKRRINIASKVDESNHGLYYAQALITNIHTGEKTTLFSKSLFIMTPNDVDNFNTDIWNNLTNKIIASNRSFER